MRCGSARKLSARAQAAAAKVTGLPLEKVKVHNHLIGGGFGRRLEVDGITQAVRIAKQVDGPVKVVWSREEDIQHDMYRPYYLRLCSAGLDEKRQADRLEPSRCWLLDPRAFLAARVQEWPRPRRRRGRVDSPTPCRIFLSIMSGTSRLALRQHSGAASARRTTPSWSRASSTNWRPRRKQDPVEYRRALLDKSPRAQSRARSRRGKGRLGSAIAGRGRSRRLAQFGFGSYLAQVAEVEVAKDGAVRVRRVVCAVDCGTSSIPIRAAQIEGAIIFGITAALYGEITLKNGRVEQTNFDTYQMLRINEAPAIEVHIVESSEPPGGMGEPGTSAVARGRQRDFRRDWQAVAKAAGRRERAEIRRERTNVASNDEVRDDPERGLARRRIMIRKAKAVWHGTGRAGNGNLSTDFRRARGDPVFVQDALREREGHQSRGVDRRRTCRMLHHGAGLSAAGRGLYAHRARYRGRGYTRAGGPGISHQPLGSDPARPGAEPGRSDICATGRRRREELPGLQSTQRRHHAGRQVDLRRSRQVRAGACACPALPRGLRRLPTNHSSHDPREQHRSPPPNP